MLRKRVHPAHRVENMPIKIDLKKEIVADALDAKISSLKRANVNETNTLIKEIREKDIAEIATAINTITEVK